MCGCDKEKIMKRNLFKYYIVVFFLLSDFMVFAQPTDDEEGDLQGGDEPAVPINGKLFWLFLCGMLYAFHLYRRQRKISR